MFQVVGVNREDINFFEHLLTSFAQDLIKEDSSCTVLGLVDDGVPVGVLTGFLEETKFSVVSLYVDKSRRRRGGATLLMNTLWQVLEQMGDEYVVEAEFNVMNEEHYLLIAFFEYMKMESHITETGVYIADTADFNKEKYQKEYKANDVVTFAQLNEAQLALAQKKAEKMGLPIPEGGLNNPHVDKRLSMAHITNGEVDAYMAVDHSIKGYPTVSALANFQRNPEIMNKILHCMITNAKSVLQGEFYVAFQALNQRVRALIEYVMPSANCITYKFEGYGPLEKEELQDGDDHSWLDEMLDEMAFA